MQKSDPANQIEPTAANLFGFGKWVGMVGVAEFMAAVAHAGRWDARSGHI